MARLVGINHIALEVGDVDDALAWYGRFFEFELRGRAGPRMAFIDMGDQFIALAAGRSQPPDDDRHFGLVVDGKEAVRAALRDAGVAVQSSGSLDFEDPWGNHVQVVDYRDIQFSKTARGAAGDEARRTGEDRGRSARDPRPRPRRVAPSRGPYSCQATLNSSRRPTRSKCGPITRSMDLDLDLDNAANQPP